jgi:hypothetical protein
LNQTDVPVPQMIHNSSIQSTVNQKIKVYTFIDTDGSVHKTIDENSFTYMTSGQTPRDQGGHSLIGLAGQLLIDSIYRPFVSSLPSSWRLIKQDHTVVQIDGITGVVTQNQNIVIGKVNPPGSNINLSYDSILIK